MLDEVHKAYCLIQILILRFKLCHGSCQYTLAAICEQLSFNHWLLGIADIHSAKQKGVSSRDLHEHAAGLAIFSLKLVWN